MIQLLSEAMRREPKFVGVHAAEALIDLGQPSGVYDVFKALEAEYGTEPKYRVVIWRVLARSAPTSTERQQWVDRVVSAFLDVDGPDRLHAVEALAKLGYAIPEADRSVYITTSQSSDKGIVIFTHWLLMQNGDAATHERMVASYLMDPDAVARLRAGYVLGKQKSISEASRGALFTAAEREAPGTTTFAYLAGGTLAVAAHEGDAALVAQWKATLRDQVMKSSNASERAAGCLAFVGLTDAEDMTALRGMLNDPDADVRIYSAFAIQSAKSGGE